MGNERHGEVVGSLGGDTLHDKAGTRGRGGEALRIHGVGESDRSKNRRQGGCGA
jgi:hypothetical protein